MSQNNYSFKSDNATLILNGAVMTNFALNGDTIVIEYPNPRGEMIAGTDNSSIVMNRADAFVANVTIRLLRGSPDDVMLNQWMTSENLVAINGTLKVVYMSNGEQATESFRLTSGIITTQPKPTHNGTDLSNMSVMQYTVQFRAAERMV